MKVYLDNASTTFPKPKVVADSIYNYLVNVGGNANRSNYSNALESSRELLKARMNIAKFFNFDKPENVIFTNNITTSLNILIKGILKSGDHVISSTMEHNSILRPLTEMKNSLNVTIDFVKASSLGFLEPSDIKKAIKPNTKLVILAHGSNVTGSIQQLKEMGEICKENNIFFIIDTAQTAGSVKVDMKDLNADAIAFTGHKSLLGPQGIGGFIINDRLNKCCTPLFSGGTGSLSHSLTQPDFLPDKFESGTLNMPGIIGLSRAIEYINSIDLSTIEEHNKKLRKKLFEGLNNINNITTYGSINNSTTCVSFNYKNIDPAEIGFYLDENGIKTRCGLHCAPLAHKTIGSFPNGTVRLSLSYFNTLEEIDYTLSVINKLSSIY